MCGCGGSADQSQSLNIHMKEATHGNMTSMHFYGWKQGLKTGMYYLRTRPAADAIKFTVDTKMLDAKAVGKTSQGPDKSKKVLVSSTGSKENASPVIRDKAVAVAAGEKPVSGQSLVEKVVGMSLEDRALACSLENKEACEMCSG